MEQVKLSDIEMSLYNGDLWALMHSGRYWRLRRNGQTQKWKTRPSDFRIPVKAGLKSCGEVTHRSVVAFINEGDWRNADFVIAASDPNNHKQDNRRTADRIDGYDRDDLGESPDY